MIWHIFKKDWKLLWPMVVGVALVNVIQRVILSSLGLFGGDQLFPLRNMSYIFGQISLLATGIVILIVVMQDAIPGLRQDWLVRPIRRRDLMLSKMLFVVLLVQSPIFITEVAQGLAAGFSFRQSLGAPFSRSLWMLLALDLPMLAFATLTRNLTEAIGTGLAVFLGFALFMTSTMGLLPGNTTIAWIVDSAQIAWSLPAIAIVAGLQYYRRKTIAARWVFGSSALVWLFVQLLPWQPAFAIQERFSPQRAAAQPVQITFDPGLGRLHRRPGALEPFRFERGTLQPDFVLYVPLRMDGAGDGRMLFVDRMKPRFTGPGGRVIELPQVGGAKNLDVHQHQLMFVPEGIYSGMKDQPIRLEMDYALTLLQASPVQSMPALDGTQVVPGVGRCATRVSSAGAEFQVACLAPGKVPCFTWTLEDYENNPCQPDYAPWFGRIEQDSMNRFGGTFAFREPANESQLKKERVLFRVYLPEAHFTRQVVIPDIRLSDWTAQ